MIKNVIFDIGGVLMRFAERAYAVKLFGEDKANIIMTGLWADGIGDMFDRGLMTTEEVTEEYVKYAPALEAEIRQYVATVGECMYRLDYAIPWIKELKALGYNVYYLSNWSQWFYDANSSILDFIPYTDGGVFSYVEHMLKPEPAIYERICEKYGLKAEECMFIDDRFDNVHGAEKCGMKGVVFSGYERSYPEVMGFLENDRSSCCDK